MKRHSFHKSRIAFTIVELLVVIAIIALLAGLFLPGFSYAIRKGQSIKCATNLHSIGVAVDQAATDNNNQYPEIDQAAAPIYTPQGPGLVAVLGPYGITTNSIQCPLDMLSGTTSSFQTYGSSYEWTPIYDDEALDAPVIYRTPTVGIQVHLSRVRLCSDFLGIHQGKTNVLWGDGHVSSH